MRRWIDRKRSSFGACSRDEAEQIILAKNQSLRQPALNLQIARAYLGGSVERQRNQLTYSFLGNSMVSMETKDPRSIASLEKHLGYWLRRVSNRVSSSFAHSLEAKEVSVPEWVVLRYLSEQQDTTPGRLAEILMMTRGAISKIVDKLETKDWIECRADVEDTRVRRISLTRSGRRVLPVLGKIADQNDAHFFGCLTVAERDVFLGLLRKLSDSHQIHDISVK